MPSQKRNSSSDNNLAHHDDSSQQQPSRRKQSRRQRGGAEDDDEDERDYEQDDEEEQVKEEEEDSEDEDSDGSRSSDDTANQSEWVLVELPALRTYVQCPICLGIIKKTRTVMECLHRFCRECIDKSMRMGNNECPACTHCASRRSLRDDPRFDALIDILYDDIEKYEEEELAFHEEEKTRNKQIQASIAQIFRRQSEALVTRRKMGKDTDSASGSRLPRKYSRRRRNTRETEHEGSDDEDENNHDANKDSSSTDERTTEIKQRRYKRKAGAQSSQPSPSAANSDGGGNENDLEASKESKATSSGPVRNTEMLAWGGGGARSKSVRNTRIMKLTKYLENTKDNDELQLDVHLILISLDKERTASSKELYLCCPPCFSVESLKEYVSRETQLQAKDIEILLVKKHLRTNGLQSTLHPSTLTENEAVLQNLEGQETLAGLGANCGQDKNHLVLAYRVKKRD
ncbi:putative E3 ubiquitin-protein ligase RING1a [Camellia lanceoleosa]|uniref:E3 ubiquitin-protein ligase RING1a n=1 Tax=Camellia lanceoleosa TaxID=1840588 RepID=A0ACC0HCH4_9ERIC|nr:putative E3 ubiquitin-protein ligase RING1a [Camellia lanceoleosa]